MSEPDPTEARIHEAWTAAVDWVLDDPVLAELRVILDALEHAWQRDGAMGATGLQNAVREALGRLLCSGVEAEALQSILERWSAVRGDGLTVTLTRH